MEKSNNPQPGSLGPDISREFRAALALTGSTVRKFAKEMEVHENHIYLIAQGRRRSRRIEAAMHALLDRVFVSEAAQ
jgi:plasmid maintenance system antidote protein VapI